MKALPERKTVSPDFFRSTAGFGFGVARAEDGRIQQINLSGQSHTMLRSHSGLRLVIAAVLFLGAQPAAALGLPGELRRFPRGAAGAGQ